MKLAQDAERLKLIGQGKFSGGDIDSSNDQEIAGVSGN